MLLAFVASVPPHRSKTLIMGGQLATNAKDKKTIPY